MFRNRIFKVVSNLILLAVFYTGQVSAAPFESNGVFIKQYGSSPSSTRFAVIGDYGLASQTELDVADQVKSWNPDFIVTTGDNNYDSGAADTIDANIGQYYHDFIFPYIGSYGTGAVTNRFFPVLGNHDWNTTNAQPYLDYFSLPGNERYYDFVQGPVHFFMLDSDPHEPDGITAASDQATWLKNSLAVSSSPWNIVLLHHAPFSSALHGSNAALQWPYEAWGADAVLAGHDHSYERVIKGAIPYFVNGLGGRSIYDFGVPIDGSQLRYNADYGAMLVDATDIGINFKFITRTGLVIDSFTLSKALTSATFTDVPLTYWASAFIERLYNAGITSGCSTSPMMYCPLAPVTRAQMAIFILRGIHGKTYTPPAATGTVFSDVSVNTFGAAWIEQFTKEGITSGCGGDTYCPDDNVTRAQMAIFLLRGKYGSSYVPPVATGVFSDVSVGSFAADWIERLAAETITSGCGGGLYCPTANVTRDQMAVFLVKTFNLP